MRNLTLFTLITLSASTALADPCGMVPPLWTGPGPAIERIGEQMTYAFFKDGVETFVIKPGFRGKVDNFGMLIPFPSPPALRKVPDDVFSHIAAAIDPPEVIINLFPPPPPNAGPSRMAPSSVARSAPAEAPLRYDEVRVLKQEAVGMYEVTVLQAGSPRALERWMDDNGYVYPDGMDKPVLDYVKARWAFVAVKTRVGSAGRATPRPGSRRVNPNLPKGASFDGAVQGMGFRFRTPEPVIPMRLSAFNAGKLRNIVYFLSDGPVRIRGLDKTLVKRQVSAKDLRRNVNELLPVRILGGQVRDVSESQWRSVERQRDPVPHSGKARELFASDLLAVERGGELALPFEEKEKVLLRIGEALKLRGDQVDAMNAQALDVEKEQTLKRALAKLNKMTITVIDGDFPREHLRTTNLTFERFKMPKARNDGVAYNARNRGPGYRQNGVIAYGPRGRGGSGPTSKGKAWWRFW